MRSGLRPASEPLKIKSLARPGKNITGVHLQQIETTGKRLELLCDLLPAARRVSVFSDDYTEDQNAAAQRLRRH